jgi:hypothetical protein
MRSLGLHLLPGVLTTAPCPALKPRLDPAAPRFSRSCWPSFSPTCLLRSYRTLRKGGRLVGFSVAATKKEGLRVIPLSLLMRTLLALVPDGKRATLTPDLGKDNAWYREALAELLDLLAGGRIKPIAAARVALADAARAHEFLEQGGYAGTAVLVASPYAESLDGAR